jgi:hypothetical protein
MIVGSVVTTLTRVGRATITGVGRRRPRPCRLVRRAATTITRRRPREIVGVDWFEGVEPDELAG